MIPENPYRGAIEEAARKAGLDPDLVEAVCWQESNFRADAFRFEPGFWEKYLRQNSVYASAVPRRVASSYGLMQIMYPAAREAGFVGEPEGLFVPEVNLSWGCKILANLLSWAQGQEQQALAAYNGGRRNWRGSLPTAYARSVATKLSFVRTARSHS